MPAIQLPIAVKYDRGSQITKLWFDTPYGRLIDEFYVMGAISWPEGAKEGYAILAGEETDYKRIYPFIEFSFMTVEHWLHPDQGLRRAGLIQFFTQVWAMFHCRAFFYFQNEQVHRRYAFECYESGMVEPKPDFLRVLYSDDKVGDNLIEEALARERFVPNPYARVFNPETEFLDARFNVFNELEAYRSHQHDSSAVHALRCLLAGFQQFPLLPKPKGPKLIPLPYE